MSSPYLKRTSWLKHWITWRSENTAFSEDDTDSVKDQDKNRNRTNRKLHHNQRCEQANILPSKLFNLVIEYILRNPDKLRILRNGEKQILVYKDHIITKQRKEMKEVLEILVHGDEEIRLKINLGKSIKTRFEK